MNTYYTAKDLEEMAANGTKQLVLGPGAFLTDYARETAQQLGIALVRSEDQKSAQKPEARLSDPKVPASSDKYNKPRACQQSSNAKPAQNSQASIPSVQSNNSNHSNNGHNSNMVNSLIDLMGKVIKRGS